ncbi:hypothetical protein P872_17655 [Rhodonellum psychrophilum GCM71 = DSM 17998]|uniref:Uncharacterized protein n=2 Tax=Rhodonellum TaxID=336827 RepID=U5C2Q3_9BACT|nr:hypothetical protein P872_17655 [Rhodonellum psychrophilum GCM71 = DSM 17998]
MEENCRYKIIFGSKKNHFLKKMPKSIKNLSYRSQIHSFLQNYIYNQTQIKSILNLPNQNIRDKQAHSKTIRPKKLKARFRI